MREFAARRLIESPPQAVFEFLADHRNAPRTLEGITRWEPLGSQTQGLGARFDVEMKALGMPIATTLVLDVWNPPRQLGWRSESGPISQRGVWTLTPRPSGTEVELRIHYDAPARGLFAGALEAMIKRRLEGALSAIERRLAPPQG